MKIEKNNSDQNNASSARLSILKESDMSKNSSAEQENNSEPKVLVFNPKPIADRTSSSHAIGAYGTFTVTNDIRHYTKANFFNAVGKQTPLLARFSVPHGSKDLAFLERTPKELALKFFTEEGSWDVIGYNTPVLLTKTEEKYLEFVKLHNRDPKTNMKNPTKSWDFLSLSPESLHHLLMVMSDRGTPRGYTHMDVFGVHTFSFVNSKNVKAWAKLHFKTLQGVKTYSKDEVAEKYGIDNDFAQRNLVDSINAQQFPKWKLFIQVMTEHEAKNFPFNPFDPTKTWSQKLFPLQEVGIMELNKLPENYLKEIEGTIFDKNSHINGISLAPINPYISATFCEPKPFGQENSVIEKENNDLSSKIQVRQYSQNTTLLQYSGGCLRVEKYFTDPNPSNVNYMVSENDHYSQARVLFKNVLMEPEKASLIENIVNSISQINGPYKTSILNRLVKHFYRIDEQLGDSVSRIAL
jgi:catalase